LIWGVFNNIRELVNLSNYDPDYEAIAIISWGYIFVMALTIVLTF